MKPLVQTSWALGNLKELQVNGFSSLIIVQISDFLMLQSETAIV